MHKFKICCKKIGKPANVLYNALFGFCVSFDVFVLTREKVFGTLCEKIKNN